MLKVTINAQISKTNRPKRETTINNKTNKVSPEMGPEAIIAESKQKHRKMLGRRGKMGIVRGLEPLEEAKRMEGVGWRRGTEHAQGHVG